MTYDLEDILVDLKAALVANLNTKIAAIGTIKGDSLSAPTIDSDAYFLQSLGEKVANFNPFIFYGVSDIRADGIGPRAIKNYVLQVVLCIQDFDQDGGMSNRMFRYGRAIEEVLEENWVLANKIKMRIEALPPADFKMQNTSTMYRCVGANVYCAIA